MNKARCKVSLELSEARKKRNRYIKFRFSQLYCWQLIPIPFPSYFFKFKKFHHPLCLIVHHEGAIRVLEGGVGGQDGVVGLHHGGRHLGSGVDGKFQFWSLSIIHRETFHKQGCESWASSSSKWMKNQEPLKPGTLVSQFPKSWSKVKTKMQI